ncbi:MAG: hypothetical protein CO186_02420 [Zetaproteobacteria bacterium CG_4_9_14_3_um_filter_49_83]|nr:MAG: hypothetical protein AUJ56_06465 [Zetaproteobacteria bacterium CG1_02_49_23]PIQ33460.1 MAG: hypothetical protein COW62_05185 [Zetaproteobacteria bacterium CG17_big_fil_post_rev_8_21_14_2_50_50_13]PIV30320.1 MAG: hypothetical protein COS35_07320 [Zetaproteobacteria bacterium CG02_land_8_20_14_3_00_50_9]PIY55667.1 MAG: hypothetical protein COZ00_08250 [Zetaproteobacteria bacterium CG_4_10_14_0_8_um_filter_49_80]PJA36018.1 MAG: hypothetical protein CO186_02420 [Zetaproteobacteria bacterium
MRLFVLFILVLALLVAFSLFPDVAGQVMRVEAFGWQFEAKQGAFVGALICLLFVFWLASRVFTALIAGPGYIWQTLKLGGRKRREERLKLGIAECINMQGDHGKRNLGKGKSLLPDWSHPLLTLISDKESFNPEMIEGEDGLHVALKARIGTDLMHKPALDIKNRKVLLQSWLREFPDSPLAQIREAEMAVEEEDWNQAAVSLERIWKRGFRSATSVKPLLATAWIHIAEKAGKQAGEYYRKALRLMPHQTDVVLAVGYYKQQTDGDLAVIQLWLDHLNAHDDMLVAKAAFEYMKADALSVFKRVEKAGAGTPALQWLRAQLAHQAGLEGLAEETMASLLAEHPRAEFWQTRGQWYRDQQQWQQAAAAFENACNG